MLILGIESSCDDCAAALVRDGATILSHTIHSQFEIHKPYGGVVPELASRNHLEKIIPVIETAMEDAGAGWADLDGIAATYGPGLVGSLIVGLSAAKALAFALDIPFRGVNHLEGHLMAIFLEDATLSFPFLGLIVSGGHTSLYQVEGFGAYRLLGQTRDDAAGEAFDKVAKLLGLGYPGGIAIDRLAEGGNPQAFSFPRAMTSRKTLDFSFSGLKTAVRYFVQQHEPSFIQTHLADLVASFQEAAVDSLIIKLSQAVSSTEIRRVVVSGGVASNSRLRSRLIGLAETEGLAVHFPSPQLCTDNAAMVAAVGYRHLCVGESSPFCLNAEPNLLL
jgi:N6-L-threonylcarbamoyladenine synthase